MTTTIQIVIQTAPLIVLFQKLINTDAALSSAGSTITQLYLIGKWNDSCQLGNRLSCTSIVPVVPAHGKRKARIHETFSECDMAPGYRQIGDHFSQRYLKRVMLVEEQTDIWRYKSDHDGVTNCTHSNVSQ
jgi:hypothetical protein